MPLFFTLKRTLNHWKELKTRPSIVHRDKLMRELREIQELSSQQIIQTQ
ncbi:hypothetical protein JCM19233_7303 [Vibrio astriarenae]|nr:hypothetical protein JCM19233_7303 [Vibrio sp. C7]